MFVPDWWAHRNSNAHCHCYPDSDSNGYRNSYSDRYCYCNGNCNGDRDSNPNGNEHALMAGSFPQAGPSFSDLSQQDQQDTPGSAPAPTGGVSINDASMAAIMTSPAQQARVAVQMSKQRLQRLAMQLKQARNVL